MHRPSTSRRPAPPVRLPAPLPRAVPGLPRTLACLALGLGLALAMMPTLAPAANAGSVALVPTSASADAPPTLRLLLDAPAGEAEPRLVAWSLPDGTTIHAAAPVGDAGAWVATGLAPGGLAMVTGTGERLDAIDLLTAPPGHDAGGHLREVTPVIDRGSLAGVAWLQGAGPGRLAVHFRPRTEDGGWGDPETVAPPGPGSQLALAVAVPGDGLPLAVWSGFDGGDDEILWSRRDGSGWTAPRRLGGDNAVPDVTPALQVLADGTVLAVWARFEPPTDPTASPGEYRLWSARFDGAAWSASRPLAGPGSLAPTLRPDGADGALVLHRDARRGAWTLLDLDRSGRPERRATASTAGPGAAPLVVGDRADALRVLVRSDGEAIWTRPDWTAVDGTRKETP